MFTCLAIFLLRKIYRLGAGRGIRQVLNEIGLSESKKHMMGAGAVLKKVKMIYKSNSIQLKVTENQVASSGLKKQKPKVAGGVAGGFAP